MSANSPRMRSVHARRRGKELSLDTDKQRLPLSTNRQRQRPELNRRQSMTSAGQRPQLRRRPGLSTARTWQQEVRLSASACPSRRRHNSPFTSTSFPRMASFDPATVRQAVAEFTPRRPEKFQDLIPAKEVIAELRQKRASYRAIAELLTQHCLPTSKTAVAVFCHEVLGEIVRPRRRPGRRRPGVHSAASPASASEPPTDTPPPAEPTSGSGDDAQPPRSRGPRIAQVRMLKPQTT